VADRPAKVLSGHFFFGALDEIELAISFDNLKRLSGFSPPFDFKVDAVSALAFRFIPCAGSGRVNPLNR
jgi:hypothetical protein